jgi:MOSC N-terminal beta barrel domain
MEYLLKYSQLPVKLLTGSLILFIVLTHKAIISFLQIIAGRLYFQLSLQLTKTTKRFVWSDVEIANSTATITSLYVYHVKSISPVACHKATIDRCGFVGDRRYMLVAPRKTPLCGFFQPKDATYRFLTQCHYPSLCKIVSDVVKSETESDSGNMHLRFSIAEGNATIAINMKPNSNALIYRTTLWDDIVNVQDMGEEAALYFQSFLANDPKTSETPHTTNSVRLVRQCDDDDRVANDRFIPSALRSMFSSNPRMHLGSAYPV